MLIDPPETYVTKIRNVIRHNETIDIVLAQNMLYVLDGMVKEKAWSDGFAELWFWLEHGKAAFQIPDALRIHISRYVERALTVRPA
jgi:hypothetical protein